MKTISERESEAPKCPVGALVWPVYRDDKEAGLYTSEESAILAVNAGNENCAYASRKPYWGGLPIRVG